MDAGPTGLTMTPTQPPTGSVDRAGGGGGLRAALTPIAVDVALPLGATVVASRLGASPLTSLTVGAVVPVVRTVSSVVLGERLNQLAALMLATSIAGIGLGLLVGDARFVVAKDAVISAVIAVGMLLSAGRGRPIMSAGLLPFFTRGDRHKITAWHRLSEGCATFQRLERRYTAIWGWVLLGDCVTRVVAAFVVPEAWLTWLGGAVTVAAIVVAMIVSGAAVGERMQDLLDAESGPETGADTGTDAGTDAGTNALEER